MGPSVLSLPALSQPVPIRDTLCTVLLQKTGTVQVKVNAGAYDGAVSKRTRGTYCTESVSAVWTAPSPHYVKQSLGKSSFFLDCAKKQGPSRVKV